MGKKTVKKAQVSWFKKHWVQLSIYSVVFFIVIFAFFFGIFVEFSHNIVQKNTFIYDFLERDSNNIVQKKEISYYELDTDFLYSCIYNFVKFYFQADDSKYIKRVTDAFIGLFERAPKDNLQNILYYIALCSVESNFKMSARSSAGAIGISQVMWSVWEKVIKENYGISKESLYTSVEDNIYVGYMIWRNYLRQNDYNIREANAGYLGADSINYNNKINFRYIKFINSLLKQQFKSGIKIKKVNVKGGD